MTTSRLNEVKAPQHDGTPRSDLLDDLVGLAVGARLLRVGLAVRPRFHALGDGRPINSGKAEVVLLDDGPARRVAVSDVVRNGSKSKKRPPTISYDGADARRWREAAGSSQDAEIDG